MRQVSFSRLQLNADGQQAWKEALDSWRELFVDHRLDDRIGGLDESEAFAMDNGQLMILAGGDVCVREYLDADMWSELPDLGPKIPTDLMDLDPRGFDLELAAAAHRPGRPVPESCEYGDGPRIIIGSMVYTPASDGVGVDVAAVARED